ncbi:MAG: hypothetical protein ACREEM_35605 [Blastocatellia bacterium]
MPQIREIIEGQYRIVYHIKADQINVIAVLHTAQQLGLTVFQEQFKVDYALLMAAVVFVTLPSVLLFFLGQRQFIKGIATTGLK